MHLTTLIATALIAGSTGAAAPAENEVFVLGALGRLHEQEESFGYETLDRAIRAIDPQVLLLEVTPEELAGRLDTKGRTEYTNVVWPLLEAGSAARTYAMEADQPHYGEMVGEGERIWSEFARQRPADNDTLAKYSAATAQVLLAHWRSPADTQDELTDALAQARNRLIASLLPGGGELQVRWDQVMIEVAREAILENPGKRVLVLGTRLNRFMFVDELKELPGVELVDMQGWLEDHGFGAEPAD